MPLQHLFKSAVKPIFRKQKTDDGSVLDGESSAAENGEILTATDEDSSCSSWYSMNGTSPRVRKVAILFGFISIVAILLVLLVSLEQSMHLGSEESCQDPCSAGDKQQLRRTDNSTTISTPGDGVDDSPVVGGEHVAPSFAPSSTMNSSSPVAVPVTYVPGDLQLDQSTGLKLSRGLTARLIAVSNHSVVYANGERSNVTFHRLPDAGATFPTEDGGWIYVSNSEAEVRNCTGSADFIKCPKGGVGAIRFDSSGQILQYQLLLGNTTRNCGGGRTPWGAWISGEEVKNDGRIWQIDPTGVRPAQPIVMGNVHSGLFESFAYDVRDRSAPRFFMTQDAERGALRRFTPTDPNWEDPWSILLGNGTIDFLVFTTHGMHNGTFVWTEDFEAGATTAFDYFPNSEGIDVVGGELMFVSKSRKSMFIVDLDDGTYHNISTKSGLFNGQPDQVERIFEVQTQENQLIYFTEESPIAGIHARSPDGMFMTILEGTNRSGETTGLSFSPDGRFMYFAYQDEGKLYEVKREDGLPFVAQVLDVRYHDAKAR